MTDSEKKEYMSKEQVLETLRDIVAREDVNAHKEVASLKQTLFLITQKEEYDQLTVFVEAGNDPTAFTAAPDPLAEEAKELIAKFRELRTAWLEAELQRQEANLKEKKEIVAQIRALTEDIDNINLHFPKFQELREAFKAIGDVPPTSETEIWKEFQNVTEQFYDHLNVNKELRALDFKKNLEQKKSVIEQAKALANVEDVIEADRLLQALREEWRIIGPVAKELRDEIWNEFQEAALITRKRFQDFFEARKAKEKENEDAKTALCDELEVVAKEEHDSFNAWDAATEKIKELQAKWRELGYASRKANAELFTRYRAICDDFFARKAEYAKKVRSQMDDNLKLKQALVEKAEALKEKATENGSLDAVRALQAEWKTIGNVGRKMSEEVWEKFSAACNYVYDQVRQQRNERNNEQNANLAAKREVIEALKAVPLDVDRKDGLRIVKELQAKWQSIGHVPFKQKDALQTEYREICDKIYGVFNESRNQERRRNFADQMEDLKGDNNKIRRERERLLRTLDQKRADLKTYENNMGFFNIKSAAGSGMLKEMERKMQRIRQDIADIKEKIKMLDEA